MWRVFWAPTRAVEVTVRLPVLRPCGDLREREASVRIRPGDPVLPAPDYRVDELPTIGRVTALPPTLRSTARSRQAGHAQARPSPR